ncbi:MAG TPA: glycosyl transferase [Bacteroidales bacterium]|nr:glycosyl transferase [Bacteroidales bacterium]
MKIIQIIYSLVPGGAERFVVDLSNEMAQHNEVILYTLRDDSLEDNSYYIPYLSPKVRYNNLKISPGFKPGLIPRFLKILLEEKPDVVHCHLNLVNYLFFSSLILKNKIRFIYTLHNSAETEVNSETERKIRRFFFKHKFFIPIAISGETKKSYQSYYKLIDVDVIYNGRKFEGKSPLFNEVKKEIVSYKPDNETLVFCHVSRYDAIQKNQEMLVSAFNKLKGEGYNIILLIIGSGFEKVNSLLNMAKDHIHFLGVKSNVNDYLYSSDAFCLSSHFEGMPISLIEAFACGCIPVCTPVGGIVDLIDNGITGFISSSTREEDYIDALKQFIRDKELINRGKLVDVYEEGFSIEKCTERYMKFYRGKNS